MPSFDPSTESELAQAQPQNPPDSDQNSPEPKRRKLDDQGGDGNNPNGESEVDGCDEKEDDRDDKAYMDLLAFLDSLEDGELAPNAPATIVDLMFGVEREKGPGRVVIDRSKLPAFSTPPQKTDVTGKTFL